MSTAILRSRDRQVYRKINLENLLKINWTFMYSIGIFLCLVLVFFYVFRVNQLTLGVNVIKEDMAKIDVLSEQGRMLETSFVESGFLGRAQATAKDLGFEKTTNVSYIQIMQNSLAKAR